MFSKVKKISNAWRGKYTPREEIQTKQMQAIESYDAEIKWAEKNGFKID